MTISLVHNSDPKKRASEYLLITLKNLEVVQVTTEITQVNQLRIQYINIDHNSAFFVNYPVIFTPLKHATYIKENRHFLNFMLMRDPNAKDITLI